MPSAEIITIGTEILLGEILDTNARYLACALRGHGINLYRKTSVGDNAERIAAVLRQALSRAEIIITTGGLGPTIDDPTREAVARAFGVELEFQPELWEQIQARFRRFNRVPTENNRRQAYIPSGAIPIENPVGTAPAFIYEQGHRSVISLPGVPREMEHLTEHAVLPYFKRRYELDEIIKARIIHTAGAGESQIDDLIGDLETSANPTVGLAAHSGQVDVRITAKAATEAEADILIAPLEAEIRIRLADWVYGADEESLESIAMQILEKLGWSLWVAEAGLEGRLLSRLAQTEGPFAGGQLLTHRPEPEELGAIVRAGRAAGKAQVGLGVAVYPNGEKSDVHITLVTPAGEQIFRHPYGGPPGNAARWALHHSLNRLRQLAPEPD